MGNAFDSLAGLSLEWTGVHHSESGDFSELSTHIVSYETERECYVTAGGKRVGEALYSYKRLDSRMAIVIYRPEVYRGLRGVVLYAMLDFENATDRAVIVADGEPFAVANGTFRVVQTQLRPSASGND
ncbi:hypothetical protein SAMN04487965_1265 [Microbulbifer donghaiensis]|uniref:Uncharacterized protein n=2 Tax=Microbulbifer donghaiensis TaxID=494016 RepID=A0A1M4YIV5_9GAMM|nr:hypothetical protein SAMN04487965_1265 [Microbulbifer donghaiensis]